MAYRPLADEIRPTSLDQVVGQRHILGPDGLLRRIIESGNIPNLVFYGPSGTGKTTVANLIAARTNRTLRRINATTGSLSDVKEVLAEVGTMMAPNGILLYLDEIQYFNKKQQQSLLEVIEKGDVTLIASTTENPYFYVYNAVLSRSSVFEFKPVEAADVLPAIDRGLERMAERLGAEYACEDGVREALASACGGDVRKALNAVELLMNSARREEGRLFLTLSDAQAAAQKSAMRYDREGDDHYDIASALMKSLRGSDPDAAVHYLARLLEAGDLITAIRRLLCSASEDIGLAYPMAVPIVKACVDSALQLGLPEAKLPLSEAAILLERDYSEITLEREEDCCRWARALSMKGRRSVVLTGASLAPGQTGAVCFDARTGQTQVVQTAYIAHEFHGTGDVFSSVLTGALVRGASLAEAAGEAAGFVRACAERTAAEDLPMREGVDFEPLLGLLVPGKETV